MTAVRKQLASAEEDGQRRLDKAGLQHAAELSSLRQKLEQANGENVGPACAADAQLIACPAPAWLVPLAVACAVLMLFTNAGKAAQLLKAAASQAAAAKATERALLEQVDEAQVMMLAGICSHAVSLLGTAVP